MATRREQLAYMVGQMSYSGKSGLEAAYEYGKQNDISAHLHEGKEKAFFEDQNNSAEWLMGQVMVLHEYAQSDDYDRTAYLMTFHSISNISMELLNKDI